jgi:hypothetical protein
MARTSRQEFCADANRSEGAVLDSHLTPSLELVASVRHGNPAIVVPDELTAFVVALHVDDRLDDWLLTTDAIAFGSESVVQHFDQWRATWERSWMLDPISSLGALLEKAAQLADVVDPGLSHTLGPVLDEVRSGGRTTVDAGLAAELIPTIEALRDAIREQNSTGIGFVNATPGYTGEGLARAWSPAGGREVLAADRHLEVFADPVTGLGVELSDTETLNGIDAVEVRKDDVVVHHVDAAGRATSRVLAPERSRPLAWVLPNATVWRVVVIPEVVVWARSFGGLIEAFEHAAALDQPVRFMTRLAHIAGSPLAT